jgi:hypothetical protein
MPAKRRTKPSRAVIAKAREVLAFARETAKQVADWIELDMALFGVHGKASELFATEAERAAFTRTAECKEIYALFDGLPSPKVREVMEFVQTANGYERKQPGAKR